MASASTSTFVNFDIGDLVRLRFLAMALLKIQCWLNPKLQSGHWMTSFLLKNYAKTTKRHQLKSKTQWSGKDLRFKTDLETICVWCWRFKNPNSLNGYGQLKTKDPQQFCSALNPFDEVKNKALEPKVESVTATGDLKKEFVATASTAVADLKKENTINNMMTVFIRKV